MNAPNHNRLNRRGASAARMAGLSLVELMVALTISVVLIFGATQVYVDSRNAYNTNEAIARLQENARYAMSVIEPDVRMSNYWGLIKGASMVSGQATQLVGASSIANNTQVLVCGTNFAVDLNTTIQGDNNQYVLSASRGAACNTAAGTGWATTPQTSSDTMTIRRASTVNSVDAANQPLSQNNVLQICSTRTAARVYSDGSACGAAPAAQVNNLIVNAYYVDNASANGTATPSLRRKSLTSIGGTKQFQDQEIMAGVEDMQVQFGVDTTGISGVATRFVNPDQVAALPAGTAIVSVRVWLLLRADAPEQGFTDQRTYAYADRLLANGAAVSTLNATGSRARAYQPSLDTSNALTSVKRFRRLLVCRTFQVRNSLGT
ncbi:MAG: PilW family protein [Steroidobacteraceae bacterium]